MSTQYRITNKQRGLPSAIIGAESREEAEKKLAYLKSFWGTEELYLEQRQVSDYWESSTDVDEQKLNKLRG